MAATARMPLWANAAAVPEKQVGRSTRARLARVQHDQAGRRLGLVEQVREARGGDEVGTSVAPDEREHALVGVDVVGAVTDEVQHVPLLLEEAAVQALPRHLLEPVQFDPARLDLRLQRGLQSFPLAVDVERGQAARRRDHGEDSQGRGDREGRGGVRRGHVPHQRFLAAQVRLRLGVVERLPWQGGKTGGGQSQGDLHARAPFGGDGHARAIGARDAAGEGGLEEPPAHVLDRRLGVRHHASRRDR